MKHSDKDIQAAKEYYLDISNEFDNEISFLAGCEHKQKAVDELVEGLEWCEQHISNSFKEKKCIQELIQKYKR